MTTKDWLIFGGIAFFLMWRQGSINTVTNTAPGSSMGVSSRVPVSIRYPTSNTGALVRSY